MGLASGYLAIRFIYPFQNHALHLALVLPKASASTVIEVLSSSMSFN